MGILGFGKKKKRPIGEAFESALGEVRSELGSREEPRPVSFDEFKRQSPARSFTDPIKPATTPSSQVKPVDQIEHEMSFGAKLKSTGLGYVRAGVSGIERAGAAIASTGKAWQQPTSNDPISPLEALNPMATIAKKAVEATGIPGAIKSAAGPVLEKAGSAIERTYGETARKISEDPAYRKEMATFRDNGGKYDPEKFKDPWVYLNIVAEGVGSFVPGAAVGLATKNPIAAGATMGLIEKGDAVQEYSQKLAEQKGIPVEQLSGEDLKKVDTQANYYGAVSAVLESAFPGLLGQIMKGGGKGFLIDTLKSIPLEGGTEGLQRFSQNLIGRLSGISPDQVLSEGVLDEAIAGALTGVAITAPTSAISPKGEDTPSAAPVPGEQPRAEEPRKEPLVPQYKPKQSVKGFFEALESGDDAQVEAISSKMSRKELQDTKKVLDAIAEDPDLTPERMATVEEFSEKIDELLSSKTEAIKNEAKRVVAGTPKDETVADLPILDREDVKKVVEQVKTAVAPEEAAAIEERLGVELDTNTLPGLKESEGLLNENNPFINASSVSEMEDKYSEITFEREQRMAKLDEQKNELLGKKKAATLKADKQAIQKDIDDIDGQRRQIEAEASVSEEQARAAQISLSQKTIDKIRTLEPSFSVAESVNNDWGLNEYQEHLQELEEKAYARSNRGRKPAKGTVPDAQPVGRGESQVPEKGPSKYAEEAGREPAGRSDQPGERPVERQQLEEVENYSGQNTYQGGVSSFYGKPGTVAPEDFGPLKTEGYIDTSKLYKGESSFDYVKENGLGESLPDDLQKLTGLKTFKQVDDAYAEGVPAEIDGLKVSEEYQKNPNIWYTVTQQLAERDLRKKGFSGAKWSHEDDLVPTQYQVWDKSVFKAKEVKTISKKDLAAAMGIPMVDAVAEGDKKQKSLSKEEIEKLVMSKDNFTEEEEALIAQYEGAGAKREAGRGLLDEFYTPDAIVEKIWDLLYPYMQGALMARSKVLEPAAGTGRFIEYAPATASIDAYETNPVSAKIIEILRKNPSANVYNEPFESIFVDEKGKKKAFEPIYDIVIGNPPYGTHRGKYKGLGEEKKIGRYEDYFIKRSLDLTKEGGIVAMVVPSGFLRGGFDYAKQQIAMRGDIIDAYRLPNGVFKGTEVGTDIVIIRKHYYPATNEQVDGRPWTEDGWFKENPDKVLGTATQKKGRFGMEEVVEGKLEDALEKVVTDRIAATETAIEEVEATEEQEAAEQAFPKKQNKKKEIEAETKAILKPAKKQPRDEKGKQKRDTDRPYVIVSDKKGKSQIISQGVATEEESYLFQNTLEDGSIDPKASFDKTTTNYQSGKYYTDFNYLQGNIFDKLEQLERDKEDISAAQYARQKKALQSVLPKRMSIKDIAIVPLDEMMKMNLGGKTLRDRFVEWMRSLPYGAFENSSSWQIVGYLDGDVVNVGDKERNRQIKKQRREVGNRLFKKFYQEELEPEYQAQIEEKFNRTYNGIVRPDYSAYPFSVELNQKFYGKPLSLRPIQLEGASFLVNKGAGLLAYEVGVGKTLAGAAAISEVMRRGWAKRPLVVVPKNLRTKWIRDLMEAIPNLKINDLGNLGTNLKYTGEWKDFTIDEGTISVVTEEGFKRLSFKEETFQALTRDLQDTTYSSKEKSARAKESEKVKAEEIVGMARKGTDFPVTFEDLGFDHITFDEAHREKNVFAAADVKKVSGDSRKANEYGAVRGAVSERGLKAYLATQYILGKNNGRNVFLLTATPFNNSPIEIYSILSLMAKKRLEDIGIKNINQFISLFVELENRQAIKANGAILEVDQVRKFQNLQQLQRLVMEYIDFRTGEEAGVPRPTKIRRKPYLKMTEYQAQLSLQAQELFNDKEAGVLKGINELQKITLSPYLSMYAEPRIYSATPKQVVEGSPKLRYAVEAIKKAHKAEPKAGQIIFVEKGVEVFEPTRQYLIKELKYKPSEVAILDGSVKESQRDEIQAKFQSGEIRILMTTIKEGIDLQHLSTDLYNLYLPWNPTDLLQVEGRTWRQGSFFDKVRIHYPLLENSVDSFMFQKLEEKAARLESVFSYKGNDLDVSDIDFEAMKFELITDPVKRIDAEYAYKEAQIRKKKSLLEAERSFATRKAETLGKLRREYTDFIDYRDKAMKENDTENVLYWDARAKKVKESIEEERERLKKSGIDITEIEATAAAKETELKAAELELEEMQAHKETKKAAAANEPFPTTFGDTDFEAITQDMAEKGFFREMSFQKMTPRELQYLKEYGGRINENVIISGYPQTLNISEGRGLTNEQAIAIFRRFFTAEEFPVEIVNRILAEDGGEAWGVTAPDIVRFVVNPKESTPYHEAVHAYIKRYLTKGQLQQVLDEVKAKAGRADMSNLEAEEMLADQFIYYVKERARAEQDQSVSAKIKRFFDWLIQNVRKLVGKEKKIEAFYEALMEKKRPGFIQKIRLILDRGLDVPMAGEKYQEMTPADEERAKMRAIVERAFEKVFQDKKPPSLGKMLEEGFTDKERRTMISAERLEAVTENIAAFAMTEGKEAGYLELETSEILSREEQIKELKQKLEDQAYKNFEDRIKLKEKIGEESHERLLSIIRLHKKMERQTEVYTRQTERLKARFAEKKEELNDKVKTKAKAQKAKFKDTLKELQSIRDEMHQYVSDHLPRKRWAKFLTAMRDAKTRKRLQSVFEAVDEEVQKIQREEAVINIKRVLRELESLPLQYQMLVHKLTDGINWSGVLKNTTKKLEKIKAYIDAHPEAETSFPMRILKRLGILENKSYKDLTTAQLLALNAKLEMIVSVGEAAKLSRKANLIKEKSEKLALIAESSQNFDLIKQSGITREEREKMTTWEKGLDKLQTVEFQLMPMDYFFRHWLDGDKENGPNYSFLKRPIEQGFAEYWKISNKIKSSLFDFIEKLKADGMKITDDTWDAIGIHAIRTQKGGTAKLLGSGYTQEQIDAVNLSEQELALYGYMRKELDLMFPMIQEVYGKVHNVQLEGVDDYFPFLMDWANRAPVYQELEAQYNNKKGVSGQGFTISRVGGKNPVRIHALESFLKHIDQSAYFIALEERVRDVREVVSDRRYQSAVGEKAQAYLMRWLEVVERHGVPVDDKSIPFLDGVRRNITLGVLAFKLTTIPIQFSAVFNGAAQIGRAAFTGFTEIVTSKESRDFVINASEQMKMRVGDSPEYKEEIPNKKLEKAREIGMWGIKKADMLTASGVWMGAYRQYLDNHSIEFSYEDVHQDAKEHADLIVRLTQGSSEFKDLPPAMAQKYRTVGKLLLQFQTFAIYQYSFVRAVVGPNVSKDPQKAAWQFAMIATNVFMVMSIRDIISRAIWGAPEEDDEEGIAARLAWELVQSIPLLGSQLYQIHRFMKDPTLYTALSWQTGIPVIDKAIDVPRSIALAAIASKDDTRDKNLVKAGEAIGSLTGIPGSTQLGQLWRSFIDQ